MIRAEDLGEALGFGSVPDEELVGILGGVLPLSRWEAGRRVAYFHPVQGHVLDVVYNRDGRIASCEPGAGFTPELLETLRERTKAAFAADAGSEVRRDVLQRPGDPRLLAAPERFADPARSARGTAARCGVARAPVCS